MNEIHSNSTQKIQQLQQFSSNPEVDRAIQRELKAGRKPLPVAGAYGKKPSYFNTDGRLTVLKDWRTVEPTPENLNLWFRDPRVGIGSTGGVDTFWLDIDLKNFESPAQMENLTELIRSRAHHLERTQSGGYRVLLKLKDTPPSSVFGLGEVERAGEIIGPKGFVVLAPTVGQNGKYTLIKEGAPLDTTIEDLGLTFKGTASVAAVSPSNSGRTVNLLELVSKKTRDRIAKLKNFEGDRSEELTAIARELYGWENLTKGEGVGVENPDTLLEKLSQDIGISHKLPRIIKGIDRSNCEPALAAARGIEACLSRLREVAGVQKTQETTPQTSEDFVFVQPEDTPGILATRHLYKGSYVRIQDSLYKFTGTYYRQLDERNEKRRIREFFEKCVQRVETKNKITDKRIYATSAKVADAYQWALMSFPFIPEDEINPAGINLINGVLTFEFNSDGTVQEKLLEHSPDRVYTYRPRVTYHPEHDRTAANKLLEAIDPEYQDAVLKVLASAFDLEAVRRKKGRAVRSLIFTGSGANGKDSLREVVSYIFGRQGITSCTIDDFNSYDNGRRFNLASLAGSRINWASENRVGVNIDTIQSLKQLVTGDPLIAEEKFQQGSEFTPRCISIFATNDRAINLTASLEAIASRYAIVPFARTFVDNPKRPGEIKADSRFKYDPQWVCREVAPGFLNVLIEKFKAIFTEGIDYSPFEKTMEQNRFEVNHLMRFAQEVDLIEDSNGEISNSVLWETLRTWYRNEEILKIDDHDREHWEESVRAGDSWVKGRQQLKRRFQKIFPGIDTFHRRDIRGIKGLRLVSPAERALRDCNNWEEYQQAVSYYGSDSIDKARKFLTVEKQEEIDSYKPEEAEEAEEPLTEENIAEVVDLIQFSFQCQTLEELEVIAAYSRLQKHQIWENTPESLKSAIPDLEFRLFGEERRTDGLYKW